MGCRFKQCDSRLQQNLELSKQSNNGHWSNKHLDWTNKNDKPWTLRWEFATLEDGGNKHSDAYPAHMYIYIHIYIYMCVCVHVYIYIFIWLLVSTPLKNISQVGWWFPIYGKIKVMFQTTNQIYRYIYIYNIIDSR